MISELAFRLPLKVPRTQRTDASRWLHSLQGGRNTISWQRRHNGRSARRPVIYTTRVLFDAGNRKGRERVSLCPEIVTATGEPGHYSRQAKRVLDGVCRNYRRGRRTTRLYTRCCPLGILHTAVWSPSLYGKQRTWANLFSELYLKNRLPCARFLI